MCYLEMEAQMAMRLTNRIVEQVQPGNRDVVIWDSEVKGLGCKITPAGRRTYFLYYRAKDGRQRRPSIGQHGIVRPEAAREIARRWLAEVAAGGDPSATRQAGRTTPTVADLCGRYLTEHAEVRKKARSIEGDRRLIDKRVIPALGGMKVPAVRRADVARLHHALRSTPYEANRTLALLHKMFALAERWGLRPDGSNPASNIERYAEEKRERFLSPEELQRLSAELDAEESQATTLPGAIAAIRLLVLTGCRLSEIVTLEWAHVDFDDRLLRLPDSKTGAKIVFLTQDSLDVLMKLHQARDSGHPFVIVGRRKGARLVNLQKPWRRIRAAAGLDDVRIHDLRHTYASVGVGTGQSLPIIGKLLGHTQPATTARYAHLAPDPARRAAELVSGAIADSMRAGDKTRKPG
jgi:integrase